MKLTKVLSAVIAGSMILGALPGSVFASDTVMTVDVNNVIKSTTAQMYGLSTDYSINSLVYADGKTNVNFIKAMNNLKLPLIRIGEAASRKFEWKQAIGDMEDREEQTLWGITGKVSAGPLEIVSAYETVNEDAEFTITLNMTTDTAQDAADYAEFLTGGADTEWGAKRIEYGHAEPINVKAYELGNELDYVGDTITSAEYIAKSKEFISAVKAVDPDAKFAAHANTAAYNGVQNNNPSDWADWHKAILADAELASEIDYISVHTYYAYGGNNIMDEVIGTIEDDIASADASDSIKIYISEHGCYYNSDLTTNPHTMRGVIETANIYSRMMWHEGVEMATYHGLSSSEWRHIVYNSDTGEMYLNGIGELSKLFNEYGVGDTLSSDFTGFKKNVNSTSSGVAVKGADGRINLIFSNKNSSDLPIIINFSDGAEYKIVKETRMLPDSTKGLDSDINLSENKIKVNKYDYTDGGVLSSYTVPAYSVCAVTVEKKADVSKTIIQGYDFTDLTKVSTLEGDGNVSVSDGKLIFNAYDTDEGANYGYNYVYLTDENTASDFRLEADIDIKSIGDEDTSEVGIIINSAASSGEFEDGNMIKLTAEGINELADDTTVASASGALTSGSRHIAVNASSDGTVDFYIDGTKQYTRSGGLKNSSGYIGFMSSDVNFTAANVEISKYSSTDIETADYKEVFTYEENFDNIEDGKLPEGWETMSSMISAGVYDGELVVNSREWWYPEVVKIGNLGNVQRDGLVMEADITFVENISGATSRRKAGFAYMMDGENKSTGGLLTFSPQAEFTESGASGNTTSAIYDAVNDFIAGEKTNVKLVFSGEQSPDIYLNGTKLTYYNKTNTTQNTGYLGLMVLASTVKFDNVKISGIKYTEYNKDEMIEKLVDFTYTENFDNITDGMLPTGYIIPDTSKTTASVSGGKLIVEGTEWYSPKGVFIGGLENVQRDGLVMEADVRLISYNTSARSSGVRTKAGFAYMYDETNISTAGLLSWFPQCEFTESGKSSKPTANTKAVYGENEGFIANETVKMKLVFSGTKSPDIYLNGTKLAYSNTTDTTNNSGYVGFMAQAAKVEIDNVVITGKRLAYIPDYSTYDAYFTTDDTEFNSAAEAAAAVKVTETDFIGTVTDITDSAEITTEISGSTCKVTVIYGENTVKVLNCTISVPVSEGFIFEENFDTYANGTLPDGWTLYKKSSSTNASVQDGGLVFNAIEWYGAEYLLFDIGDVERQGLSIEYDITRIGAPGGNANNSSAGIAYAASADGNTVTADRNGLYTDKDKDKLSRQQGTAYDAGSNVIYTYNNIEGNQLYSGATKHVKIEFNNTTQSPVVYVDGVQPDTYNRTYSQNMTLSGLIGFYGYSAKVKFDNLKITGTRLKTANKENEISVNASTVNNGTPVISVSGKCADTNISSAAFAAAVYDNETKELVTLSIKDWNTSVYKTIKTDIVLDGITDYSKDKYDIKIMAFDKATLKPVSGAQGVQ